MNKRIFIAAVLALSAVSAFAQAPAGAGVEHGGVQWGLVSAAFVLGIAAAAVVGAVVAKYWGFSILFVIVGILNLLGALLLLLIRKHLR